ncbi:hypothetical protein LYNGBM3L_30260 [Moorena producens 3L]|uniref:Uncharacterized protein n=1 Tax=Moorena producens 3L TaxID=489825 RepID=F4XTZ4_9CYAN|nr:hypothetical protein LYNGBM3L_30260 [Moorena producens 3L]
MKNAVEGFQTSCKFIDGRKRQEARGKRQEGQDIQSFLVN